MIWFVFSISNLLGCFKQNRQTQLGCLCLCIWFYFFRRIDVLETAYRLKIMSGVSMSILHCRAWLGYHASASLGTAGIAWALRLCEGLLLCVPPFPSALYGFSVIGAMTGLGPQASCVSSRFSEPYQRTLEPLVLWFWKGLWEERPDSKLMTDQK